MSLSNDYVYTCLFNFNFIDKCHRVAIKASLPWHDFPQNIPYCTEDYRSIPPFIKPTKWFEFGVFG